MANRQISEHLELTSVCLKSLPDGPDAWERATSTQSCLERHANYWWNTSGYALAVLLHDAGYSYLTQARALGFFCSNIAPNLGVALDKGTIHWPSFMTDDHTPVELSWDWHEGHQNPTIRFSMEVVGLAAGTADDPHNETANENFAASIVNSLTEADALWFNYFYKRISKSHGVRESAGHKSKLFWAFDIGATNITTKAYFLCAALAASSAGSNLQAITDMIRTAPQCTPEKLTAYDKFVAFHNSLSGSRLEIEMLAIDLLRPEYSRLKIYFRNRDTSFESVRQMMTLGGEAHTDGLEAGLQNLRTLWNSLFSRDAEQDSTPLLFNSHRTAGILYNVEFYLGSSAPRVKIYIPVRHYATTDAQIMEAVNKVVDGQSLRRGNKKPSQSYVKAIHAIFTEDSLTDGLGVHTYIGCSIKDGGQLRVVSYINPSRAGASTANIVSGKPASSTGP
ncbi:tryptophan dimethylallyltransferase-domain-containing protein [Xylaria acuta]|nr:tryptophan dimethylallyltransferase-domain-containing protein [Xylaria acuta]